MKATIGRSVTDTSHHFQKFPWCKRSMALCEGVGTGATPGGNAISFEGLAEVIAACLSVEQVEPERNRRRASNSSEALTVMHRPFNPVKKGQYLPGEPIS